MINNQPSELRQYLDTIAASLKPDAQTEVSVILKMCQNIAMWAGDKSKPMPLDVFAIDLDDTVARAMLSSFCLIAVKTSMAQQAQRVPTQKIIVPKSKSV